jgi:hypothetical protein
MNVGKKEIFVKFSAFFKGILDISLRPKVHTDHIRKYV